MNDNKEIKKEDKYVGLVLSGGSVRGILHLGALCYATLFPKFNHLKDVKYYVGTSIGSVICLLILVGYSPQEIMAYILDTDFKKLLTPNSIPNIIKYGYYDFGPISDFVATMVEKKWKYIPTLKEVYDQTQKELIIVTYNMNHQSLKYITKDSDPKMTVIEAITLSCSIPYLFHKTFYKKERYIDGGFADNCAIYYLCELVKKTFPLEGNKILALEIKNVKTEIKDEHILNDINIYFNVFMDRISELQQLLCQTLYKDKLGRPIAETYFLTSDLSMMDFHIDKKKKLDLFQSGFNTLKNSVTEKNLPKEPPKEEISSIKVNETSLPQRSSPKAQQPIIEALVVPDLIPKLIEKKDTT